MTKQTTIVVIGALRVNTQETCSGYLNCLKEEMRIKQGLSYVLFYLLRSLYDSKFILMSKSLGQMLSL